MATLNVTEEHTSAIKQTIEVWEGTSEDAGFIFCNVTELQSDESEAGKQESCEETTSGTEHPKPEDTPREWAKPGSTEVLVQPSAPATSHVRFPHQGQYRTPFRVAAPIVEPPTTPTDLQGVESKPVRQASPVVQRQRGLYEAGRETDLANVEYSSQSVGDIPGIPSPRVRRFPRNRLILEHIYLEASTDIRHPVTSTAWSPGNAHRHAPYGSLPRFQDQDRRRAAIRNRRGVRYQERRRKAGQLARPEL